jgi:putative CocE/NonD family hydrolase
VLTLTTFLLRLISFTLLNLALSFTLSVNAAVLVLPSSLYNPTNDNLQSFTSLLSEPAFIRKMKALAQQILKDKTIEKNISDAFSLHMVNEQYDAADVEHHQLLALYKKNDFLQYKRNFADRVYLSAKLIQSIESLTFDQAYAKAFNQIFENMSLKQAHKLMAYYLHPPKHRLTAAKLYQKVKTIKDQPVLSNQDALALLRQYQSYRSYQLMAPLSLGLINQYQDRHYIIDKNVLIKSQDGAIFSAILVRSKAMTKPSPTALQFSIYANEQGNTFDAINAVNHGYVGIVADTRGKRLSPDEIIPYEHDAKDVTQIIDWISKQDFSDGRVAMYGGSYLGFTQWAATKYMHPALKTIVPSVANNPMQGLPMENNIFITPNIQWPFHVMNNKMMDNSVYQGNHWSQAIETWYQSGRAFRDLDKVEGTPNPWLQNLLDHPSHDDAYWQSLGPYKTEYANINIPILSINGYYDDGHISALDHLLKHEKYNKNAEHYWLIGPYNHVFSQSETVNDYQKDPVAALDRAELAFAWFDYVLKGAKKPDLIKDKVNYQLMGDNSWQHAASMAELNSGHKRFYLTTRSAAQGPYYQLSEQRETRPKALKQTVDLADRKISTNTDSYYWPVIKDALQDSSGFSFVSAPFSQDTSVHGSFSGEIKVKINKRDFDLGLTFYELMANGKLFQLSFYIARASYAKDGAKRQLLTPGIIESIPFAHTRMTGKLFKKGSRLLVVANVNKNSGAQVNYGTGKDVSDETWSDGHQPLIVEWYNSSFINVPMKAIVN